MGRIAEEQRENFWAGFDQTFQKLGFNPDFQGTIRNLHTLYNAGENINILIESLDNLVGLDLGDVNWFAFPGLNNCSEKISSAFGGGFKAIGWHPLTLFDRFPNVYEHADVIPGHFGMNDVDFRVVKPGEEIRAGCVKISMDWSDPRDNIIQVLSAVIGVASLAVNITNWLSAYEFAKTLYKKFPRLFNDAVKILGRDHFKLNYPWWYALHAEAIWRIIKNEAVLIGQELFMVERRQAISDLYAQMEGERPGAYVLEPTFIYG